MNVKWEPGGGVWDQWEGEGDKRGHWEVKRSEVFYIYAYEDSIMRHTNTV
jgi:hypothetical protein